MLNSIPDPVRMNRVTNTAQAPYVIEGQGPDALKMFFECEANKTVWKYQCNLPIISGELPAQEYRASPSRVRSTAGAKYRSAL